MEIKKIEKPPLKLPVVVGVVGVFSNSYSSSVFFADAFARIKGVKSVIRYDYRRSLKENVNFITDIVNVARKVDLMIIMKGSGIPLQAFKMCAKQCVMLYWMMDTYAHFTRSPMMLENSLFCDYRTATGYGTCELWENKTKLPVSHVMDGSVPDIYNPAERCRKIYDVSFIGGSDRERDSVYNILKNKFKVKFFGPKYSNKFIKPKEFRQICCNSKIVLNISRGNYDGYSSLRLWNLLACGSMVMTKRIPRMTELMGLEEGVHLAEFKNIIELQKKIEYYLKHDDERKEIGRNGREFLLKNRTWDHSARDIIKLVSTTPGQALIPETMNLVLNKKRNRKRNVPKQPNKPVNNKKSKKKLRIPKKQEEPVRKKPKRPEKVGVSRRVKAGWITA